MSVVSDNKLVEGLQPIGTVPDESVHGKEVDHIVRTYAGVSKKGYAPYNPRKRNQDAIMMVEDAKTMTLLFGVMDGHGEAGDLVSHYITGRLPDRVFANKKWETDAVAAVSEEVARLEKAVLSDASIDTDFSGTTCVVCAIRDRIIDVANIGDSRIIVGRAVAGGKFEAVPLSDDHKPDRPDEQRRIEAAGGRVFAVEYDDGVDGPPRVWLGHMDIPGLAMARSLGDAVAHTAGVISTPETNRYEVVPEDKIVVLASDGLWEFMSNQEVIDMIVKTGMDDPKRAVDALVEEANQRWLKEEAVIDDTTVIVAFLK